MTEQSLTDLSLNLNGQSWAVLHLLNGYGVQLDDDLYDSEKGEYLFESQTYAFYNGRERGFSLAVEHSDRKERGCLVVAFAENRNSDDIVVYTWKGYGIYQPPLVSEMPDNCRKQAFFCKSPNDAVWTIWDIVKSYLAEQGEAIKDSENSRGTKLQARAV
jgi:hypothetical protein